VDVEVAFSDTDLSTFTVAMAICFTGLMAKEQTYVVGAASISGEIPVKPSFIE
jgi:hypothetical protein